MPVSIQLRHFAFVREILGRSEETRSYDETVTAEQVFEELAAQFPQLGGFRRSILVMVNQEYATLETELRDGDEVAFIPPVSGGGRARLFRITSDPIDPREAEDAVRDSSCGAVITFTGEVREMARGQHVTALDYEAYSQAAESMMARIAEEIETEIGVDRIAIIHRTGLLMPGDASVVIAVASPHRDEAFRAARHAIERLKQIVPIWKKEHYEGGAVWIGSEAEYQRDLHGSEAQDSLSHDS